MHGSAQDTRAQACDTTAVPRGCPSGQARPQVPARALETTAIMSSTSSWDEFAQLARDHILAALTRREVPQPQQPAARPLIGDGTFTFTRLGAGGGCACRWCQTR